MIRTHERREAALSIDDIHALHAFPCYTSMRSPCFSSHIVVNLDLVLLALAALGKACTKHGRLSVERGVRFEVILSVPGPATTSERGASEKRCFLEEGA